MNKIGNTLGVYQHTIFLALSCGLLQASEHVDPNTVAVYFHGFTSTPAKADAYIDAGIIPKHCKRVNYSDASISFVPSRGYGVALDFWRSCIGQTDDIKRSEEVIAQYRNKKIFVTGESRGAATGIGFLGSEYAQYADIVGAVLDSPFDTVNSVIDHQISRLRLQWLGLTAKKLERAIPYVCWNYDPNGIQPIDCVSGISHNIPVLLICSAEDIIVPYTCSVALYRKLLESGHKQAYLLPLEKGRHGWIMHGPQGGLYRDVIHGFYDEYDIEHGIKSDDISPRGHDILKEYCQPTLAELEQPCGVKFLGFN